ncbi:MAG TPA: polysaccharide biosynthesis/export family protein [Verrucomicrobiae bacterium]|nr:polysaccharide biosynthesis/export family protein [Verrucomicrobiae bacterium]
MFLLAAVAFAGCQTDPFSSGYSGGSAQAAARSQAETLREGDVLQIAFPGSPNLDTKQQIRRDGRITLPLIGEVEAAGLTADQLQAGLVKLYAPQLSTKEVTVAVVSSTFPVYVTGCVLRPGKVESNQPLTVLEAIMEAGGFDNARANLRDVHIVRYVNGQQQSYSVNLLAALHGEDKRPFYLKPSDIVYVPERFSIF